MLSKSPSCCSPNLFSSPVMQLMHDSVLWMGWERNGLVWQLPTELGKPVTHSNTLISSPTPWYRGRNHEPRRSLSALSCAALKKDWCGWSQTIPLTLSNASKLIVFGFNNVLELFHWNLDFQKWFLIYGWLSKTLTSKVPRLWLRGATGERGLQTMAWSTTRNMVFMPITWSKDRYWPMMLDPTACTKAFVCEWMANCAVERSMSKGYIF